MATGIARISLVWAVLLGLLVLREPSLLTDPRLWAEEGSVYLSHALTHSFFDTIAAPHLGYYSLIPTLITALAPLEAAADATTFAALLWQLATLGIILASRSPLLPTLTARTLLCTLLLLTSPAEVWLNTINAQHWGAVGVFVILFSDMPDGKRRWLVLAYLAVACLTGIPALLFAIFLPIRWMVSRTRFWRAASIIAAACLAIQLAAFFASDGYGAVERFTVSGAEGFFKYLLATAFWSGTGLFMADRLLPTGIVIGLLMTVWLAFTLLNLRTPARLGLTLLPMLVYILVATYASDGMTGGPRYGLPAMAFTIIALIFLIGHLHKNLQAFVFATMIALQVPQFLDMSYVFDPAWPTWKDQLARRDPTMPHPVEAWPPAETKRFGFTIPAD